MLTLTSTLSPDLIPVDLANAAGTVTAKEFPVLTTRFMTGSGAI
jgi:hypothetical protein